MENSVQHFQASFCVYASVINETLLLICPLTPAWILFCVFSLFSQQKSPDPDGSVAVNKEGKK